jgi:hypothetical protein
VWDNVFLVSRVDADIIHLITNTGIALKFHMDNFESGVLKMDVWHYKPEAQQEFLDLPFEPEEPEEEPEPNKEKFSKRSQMELTKESQIIAKVLKREGRILPLADIIKLVKECGLEWYPKNASANMRTAMNRIPQIKKIGYGLYKYEK